MTEIWQPKADNNLRGTQRGQLSLWTGLLLLAIGTAFAEGDNLLVGTWVYDEGFQVTELTFRSDGRYRSDTRSTDPVFDSSSTEGGRYELSGSRLTLAPYDYFGTPGVDPYDIELAGGVLTLHPVGFEFTKVYQYMPGSRESVLQRQQVAPNLIGTWTRHIEFFGDEEYTFRPGGYYFEKDIHADSQFPPDFVRGRYAQDGAQLILTPYSGVAAQFELDFFGNTLTIIQSDGTSGKAYSYEKLPGSEAEVRAKAAEAEAFLSQTNWQVGVWQIREDFRNVDLTIRPDGHYSATNSSEFVNGIVRGRYVLDPRRIHLQPFVGQGIYTPNNGEFGKVERTRELDYYDGELQFIDLEAISQSVTLARKKPGSDAMVMEKTRQAQAERQQAGWQLGIWEVNDPAGWMEFTFRPDNRYIAKAGTQGVPSKVERGKHVFSAEKVTLAPYSGLGSARGFELDYYDGDLFLAGDLNRLVVARKVPGSETGVVEKTLNPTAMKGERGSILGHWTANMPGQFVELVFRDDGQFRLKRCSGSRISQDYGLYKADVLARTLNYDSRFVPVQAQELDFYGDTLTVFGGVSPPSTYTVNLGTVDSAIQASFAEDAAEALIDAQWLARVPIAPPDPNAVQLPAGDIPADPNPTRIFNTPTVFKNYQFYRRLVPGLVHFNVMGRIESVPVVNTREWHFFPTGRVLVRFKNYHAGVVYPTTVAEISDSWGAYNIAGKPEEQDILHIYADNSVFFDMDRNEQMEMTLEDGRRNLFWGKDYQLFSEWAAEQKPIPCELPGNPDPSLMNTGVALTTSIAPDPTGEPGLIRLSLTGPASGNFTLTGTSQTSATLIVERATSLGSPAVWEAIQTNSVPAGPFTFTVPQGTSAAGFFRIRSR